MRRFSLCILLPLLCLSCAGKEGPEPFEDAPDLLAREEVDIKAPGGPIPAPRLPSDLARYAPATDLARSAPATEMSRYAPATEMSRYAPATEMSRYAPATEMARSAPGKGKSPAGAEPGNRQVRGAYAYTLESLLQPDDPARQGAAGTKPQDDKERDAEARVLQNLLETFSTESSLGRLADKPPQNRAGLERRLALSLEEGRDMLRSQGWYSGRLRGEISAPALSPAAGGGPGSNGGGKERSRDKALVKVLFIAGQRFMMGESRILANLPPMPGKDGERAAKKLPRSLADAGLPPGAPAVASKVLAAVESVRESFLNNGFPFAEVSSTRFVADRSKSILEAEVRISPGPFVLMGDIEIRGDISVRPAYVEALRRWKKGRPWSRERIEALREALRQSGLFQRIDIEAAADDDENGLRPVLVTLSPALERTLSGALKYHTDFGPGLQGAWEHRNLTGKGDSLRFVVPLWLDMQEATAAYRLPFFLRRDQDFIANAGFLNQDTDAYRLTSAAASAGLQRRLSRFLTASFQGSAQGGSIKEPDEKERDYLMYGLPLTLAYDSTRNPLDAASGQRLLLAATPYVGSYNSDFSVLRARLEGQTFLPLAGDESLVLALKGVVGAVGGDHADNLPPSVRFYSGGGGSVRGYEFQSIGPRNADDKPLGGGSLLEMSGEARWKITPEFGLVAFVDGGSAYEDVFEDPGQTLRWGAGLGLRYYTAIGPVRLDAATPLNPRDDDDPVQFYISIGQSF